ncbi:hypothetical protein LIA77_01616 [Sarocladium implicatum]|nr:hypothetical protein LIA77_01616 [Sarocladium implicatum]
MPISSWYWPLVENHIYARAPPPSRSPRTVPLRLICVGPPRSATESLAEGLKRLGLKNVYHGWDLLFEKPNYSEGWVRLARRKWLGEGEPLPITAEQFDEVLGHSEALVDAPGSVFAAELIKAYPQAKVVLNVRQDKEAWMRSMRESVMAVDDNWGFWFFSWFTADLFWAWNVYERYLWPGLFRHLDANRRHGAALEQMGKWVYEEHCNMIRGLVPKDHLLEWTPQDGYKPLCEFLDMDVIDEPFPHINTKDKGWKDREAAVTKDLVAPGLRNFAILTSVLVGGLGYGVYRYWA